MQFETETSRMSICAEFGLRVYAYVNLIVVFFFLLQVRMVEVFVGGF